MKCLSYIRKQNWIVDKHSTFYNQKITNDKTLHDLKGMRLRGIRGDQLRAIKSLLLSTVDNPPFWDFQEVFKQNLEPQYIYNKIDVSATSIAEAAEEGRMVLSFQKEEYNDIIMNVLKDSQQEFQVPSIGTLSYMVERLWENGELNLHEYLMERYKNTRLNFSLFEPEYGFQEFESFEIRDCIQSFDRFVKLESWEKIFQDNRLHYKKYSPSSQKKNWFQGIKYQGKQIDKFRCVNPKRCFGYREEDVFYVLRMERDHKISDNG